MNIHCICVLYMLRILYLYLSYGYSEWKTQVTNIGGAVLFYVTFTYILDLRFEYCLYSYIEWKTQVTNIGGVCVLYMLRNTYIMFVFLIAFTFVAIGN